MSFNKMPRNFVKLVFKDVFSSLDNFLITRLMDSCLDTISRALSPLSVSEILILFPLPFSALYFTSPRLSIRMRIFEIADGSRIVCFAIFTGVASLPYRMYDVQDCSLLYGDSISRQIFISYALH